MEAGLSSNLRSLVGLGGRDDGVLLENRLKVASFGLFWGARVAWPDYNTIKLDGLPKNPPKIRV